MLTAVPDGVVTEIRPKPIAKGTLVEMVVLVVALTVARAMLNFTLLLAGVVSKFVPVIVTGVPGVPLVGLKPVIVGGPPEAVTVKAALLVADPAGAVTAIGPVVAPDGTLATISVGVDELTVAATPLNVTVFSLGVALNPVPEIVTVVPTGPLLGVNSMIDTSEELWREIESRLPTSSYVYITVSRAGSTTPVRRPNSS